MDLFPSGVREKVLPLFGPLVRELVSATTPCFEEIQDYEVKGKLVPVLN
jgi:hypothetical protein